jgi:segregation and condensation protein A
MLVLPPEVIAPPEEEEEAPLEQFRENLFQQLAEYRKVREAAKKLLELAARSGKLHGRAFSLQLPGTQQKTVLPMRVGKLEIWDLVSAFGRLMREIDPESVETVSSDPTPLSQVIDSVKARILAEGPLSLRQLFTEPKTRGRLISLFLAILELARHQGALLRQDAWLDDIVVWFDENPKQDDVLKETGDEQAPQSPFPDR